VSRPQPFSIEDLSRAELLPADPVAVYISGSRVLGWAHANSDVDAFVVTSDRPDFLSRESSEWTIVQTRVSTTPPEITIAVAFIGHERCDVEYWLEVQVDELVRRVEESDVAGGLAGAELDQAEIDFLFRLSVGVPLAGSDWLAERQARVAASDFANVVAARRLDEADGFVDDAVGQLRSGDVESALLAGRAAFGAAVDALLALAGELYPNPKWRVRKLRRTQIPAISWDEYWTIETMQEFDPREARVWVETVLARTQALMLEAELK
jgi:hypothetical protein